MAACGVNSGPGHRLRVKSETLSKTFKRTQIPRGQDKTCISQVGAGGLPDRAWQGVGLFFLLGAVGLLSASVCVCV